MRSFRLAMAPAALFAGGVALIVTAAPVAAPAADWRQLDPAPSLPASTIAPQSDVPSPSITRPSITPIGPMVAPFTLMTSDAMRDRAVDCLTAAVYYEAATEPRAGQEAVAQVVLNRLRNPAFPKSVCGVIYDGVGAASTCQFTFACDGSTARRPVARLWDNAHAVAQAALSGYVATQVGAATHYHAVTVSPYWRASLTQIGQIGNHIFYAMPGRRGTAAGLTGQYSGDEPAAPPPGQRSILASAPASASARAAKPGERSVDFTVWGLKMATISVKRGQLIVKSAS